MKRISAVILAMTVGLTCTARHKVAIGTDLGNVINRGLADFYAGYELNEQWTIKWEVCLDIKRSKPESDMEYSDHQAEFSALEESCRIPHDSAICVQYWPDSAYEGFFLGAGCRCTELSKAEYTLAIGYSIPVWKGLRMTLGYEADMLASFKEGKASGKGLTIGICWIIKKKER